MATLGYQDWLNQQWSEKTRDHAIELNRLYREALDASYKMPMLRIVKPGGIWSGTGRSWGSMLWNIAWDALTVGGLWVIWLLDLKLWLVSLLVISWLSISEILLRKVVRPYVEKKQKSQSSLVAIGAFVRDAIVRHIRINTETMFSFLDNRLSIAKQPTPSETSLRVKSSAPPEVIGKARTEAEERQKERKDICKNLATAVKDLESLRRHIGSYKPVTARLSDWSLKIAFKHLGPILGPTGLVWGLIEIGGAIGLCFSWILLYHLLGAFGIVFHDSEYRKYLLFEGYMGTPSDGIRPLFPPVSRKEKELYEHLEVSKPHVVLWAESVWPGAHYAITIFLVIGSYLYFLIISPNAKDLILISILGLSIVGQQVVHAFHWLRLIIVRWGKSV